MDSPSSPHLPPDAGPVAARWDEEYRQDRYVDEPPLPFVSQVLEVLQTRRRIAGDRGLYVGCGNGRNFLPFVDAGLDLYGVDLSPEALKRLAERRPTIADRLFCEDFRRYRAPTPFAYLIAIQVFQHGTLRDVTAYFRKSADLLEPGGLLFVRVNSVSTQVHHRHTVIERTAGGGTTIRYKDGPKQGLAIHFYSRAELHELTREAFRPLVEPREDLVTREPPKSGHWAQWEMVWERH